MDLEIKTNNSIEIINSEKIVSNVKEPEEYPWLDYCKRVTLVALPFLALHKPLNLPVSLVQGGIRTYSSSLELFEGFEHEDITEISSALLSVIVSIISIAGTIFAHPLGSVISRGYHTGLECYRLIKNVHEEKFEKALENVANIINNTLYFTLLLYQICELVIVSLITQILLKIYKSKKEFCKDHYIEFVGHLLMAGVRSTRFIDQVNVKCAIPQ